MSEICLKVRSRTWSLSLDYTHGLAIAVAVEHGKRHTHVCTSHMVVIFHPDLPPPTPGPQRRQAYVEQVLSIPRDVLCTEMMELRLRLWSTEKPEVPAFCHVLVLAVPHAVHVSCGSDPCLAPTVLSNVVQMKILVLPCRCRTFH